MANELIPIPIGETTWGDCPNSDCREYGRMKYRIEPGDPCEECWTELRWWDKWNNMSGREHDRLEAEARHG